MTVLGWLLFILACLGAGSILLAILLSALFVSSGD